MVEIRPVNTSSNKECFVESFKNLYLEVMDVINGY